ncbi:MAG TPA: RDD family protein [Burkholderiales bacterium]|nr:RDD family protein [Burkholderiales bacterium]
MATGQQLEYVGFWTRVVASLVDTVLMLIIIMPVLLSIYGREYLLSDKVIEGPADFLLTWLFPAIAVLAFWSAKQATPGKMLYRARIVDANHGGKPSTLQYIVRYLGYFVSVLPLCLGLFWVAWDRRKQGWHDKLAGTVVVRPSRAGTSEVAFPDLDRFGHPIR